MVNSVIVRAGVRKRVAVRQETRTTADVYDLQAVTLFGVKQTLIRDKTTQQSDDGQIPQRSRRLDLKVIVVVRQRGRLEVQLIGQNLGFRKRSNGVQSASACA